MKVRGQLHPIISDLKIPPSPPELYFNCSYEQESGQRGICNWLIPDLVMIGQYPGSEDTVVTTKEAHENIFNLINFANIRVFCSLQDEIPPQDDFVTWELYNGKYPKHDEFRQQNRYLHHYAPLANEALQESHDHITFLHSPITDLSIPNSSSLYILLFKILEQLETRRSVYIHCWRGRGRAATIGAILLGILYPHIEPNACLEWVQQGYDSRDGAEKMRKSAQKSPQTEEQREYVLQTIREFRGF